MQPAIDIRDVTKTFGPKRAVKSLDLTVESGRVYGFIGPNGAGKTTTIRMIMSIIFPDTGTISVLGKASAVESKDRIGYLPEERGVYKKMRVGAFLKYMAVLKGIDGHVIEGKVRTWLERVGLMDCYKKKCEELSKGMLQKVQYVAAVLHDPDLIILDEPFSGLDPVNRKMMRDLFQEQKKAGRTLIFSTHAMFEAEQLCDHLVMINRGSKVLDMNLEDVWAKYDPRTIAFEPDGEAPDDSTLQRVSGVRDVTHHGREISLRLTENADPSRTMGDIALLGRMRRIEIKKPSLEDVFIELVGGSPEALRAEASDASDESPAAEVARA